MTKIDRLTLAGKIFQAEVVCIRDLGDRGFMVDIKESDPQKQQAIRNQVKRMNQKTETNVAVHFLTEEVVVSQVFALSKEQQLAKYVA